MIPFSFAKIKRQYLFIVNVDQVNAQTEIFLNWDTVITDKFGIRIVALSHTHTHIYIYIHTHTLIYLYIHKYLHGKQNKETRGVIFIEL